MQANAGPTGAEMNDKMVVEFVRCVPQARLPKRAERSGAGYIPSRAMRYCDALTTSTGYGYWVFPPIDIRLIWDGEEVLWSYGGDERWLPLSATASKAVQFPGYADLFDQGAPEALRGYSPPFLTAMPELGGVQIWTGLLARTRPGWSLSVRLPVNLPTTPGLTAWEGIIETDVWLGPLFSNFRITRTNVPIYLRADVPFLQVQPIPQIAYSEEVQAAFECTDLDHLSPTEWGRLGEVLLPHPDPEVRQGSYAVSVRRRRACPVDYRSIVASKGDI